MGNERIVFRFVRFWVFDPQIIPDRVVAGQDPFLIEYPVTFGSRDDDPSGSTFLISDRLANSRLGPARYLFFFRFDNESA